MKSFPLFFLMLSVLSFSLFSACSDDDSSPGIESKITVAGVDYELSRGFIEPLGEVDPGEFDVFVVLTSEGIDATSGGDFIGMGTIVIMSFTSSAEETLPNGTYTLVGETFQGAGALLEADFSMEVDIDEDEALIGASVTVSGTDSAKEINYNFTRPDGSSGSLSFVGTLRVLR